MATIKDIKLSDCTCKVCKKARYNISQIFQILDVYGWILDFYVVDFFKEKLWKKLPKSWQLILQDIPLEEFGSWLARIASCKIVLPLSLLALRSVIDSLQLQRDHSNPFNVLYCENFIKSKFSQLDLYSLSSTIEKKKLLKDKKAMDPSFIKVFKKHVKMKKKHEIEQMAEICAHYTYESKCKCIVDIGAGVGHLARVLAFQYGLYVACIEQDPLLSEKARIYDQELLSSIHRQLPDLPTVKLQHVAAKLETSNTEIQMNKQLQNIFTTSFNVNVECLRYGIIGLHSCGNLAAELLNLYSSESEARFICIVGCCYMKMALQCGKDNKLRGYPLSQYLLSSNNCKLSYNAFEVACHAIEKHSDKLRSSNYEDLKVHTYRAALEHILTKRRLLASHCKLKNVKVTNTMKFKQYCALATRHLKPELRPQDEDIMDEQIQNYLKQWRLVVIFSSLRALIAPLVETVVLLDRFLYLSERGLNPIIRPVFDPKMSPRNFVLISVKDHLT